MKRAFAIVALGLLAAGCTDKSPQAPEAPGVCYEVIQTKAGAIKFNVVKRNVATLENCAAELDVVRFRFLGLGRAKSEIVGAYGGKFLFIDQAGVRISTTPSMDSGQFQAFARASDGRLAIPSYIPQPGPTQAANTPAPPPEKK
jgi:hypothetical protein